MYRAIEQAREWSGITRSIPLSGGGLGLLQNLLCEVGMVTRIEYFGTFAPAFGAGLGCGQRNYVITQPIGSAGLFTGHELEEFCVAQQRNRVIWQGHECLLLAALGDSLDHELL